MDTKNKSSPLVEPRFGYADDVGNPYQPTVLETLRECGYVLDVFHNPSHALTVINFGFELFTLFILFTYLSAFWSSGSFIFLVALVLIFATVHNTIWYHRYCSDISYQFTRLVYARIILWTNPLAFIFREEIYAIPHKIHHQKTEKPGDPYGPHLGYFASFFAPELTQRINSKLSEPDFEALKKSIKHIGLCTGSYGHFTKTGSIESVTVYAARSIVSQSLWIAIALASGGMSYVTAYYSAIFIITMLIRDFNWRGHGGSSAGQKRRDWEFHTKSYALNQYFYGWVASEWHDNHHHYFTSARNGYLRGQIDIAFHTIKFLHKLGIVKSYIDATNIFRAQCQNVSEQSTGDVFNVRPLEN